MDIDIDETLRPSPQAKSHSNSRNHDISVLTGKSEGQQGTHISDKGIVTINSIVNNPDIPFLAVRDTIHFLEALFPGWSTPTFISDSRFPNEVGATYTLQMSEKRRIEHYDGMEDEVSIMRKLTISIHEIIDELTLKRISYNVRSVLVSDGYDNCFPPMTYIIVDLSVYRSGHRSFHFKVKFDGGPHRVELSKSCFCLTSAKSMRDRQAAHDMKPVIFRQADTVIQYIRHYQPKEAALKELGRRRKASKKSSVEEEYFSSKSRATKGTFAKSPFSSGETMGTAVSKADEIKKLYELFTHGALSKQEYETEKANVLGSSRTVRAEPAIFNSVMPGNQAEEVIF